MNRLDNTTTIIDEVFRDDDCANERTGADWFGPRIVSMAEFLENRSAAAETEAVIRKGTLRSAPSFDDSDRGAILAKEQELRVSTILFGVICLASIVIVFFGGPLLFWTPIALGSFGVCGSSALYFRQLRISGSQETEPMRSYG